MNIGKLKDRLQVIKHVEVSPDEGMGAKYEWRPQDKIWSEMLKQRVSPVNTNGDAAAVLITQGFKIRPTKALEKGDRVAIRNVEYDVIDVDQSQPDYYVLTTKAVIS